MGDFIIYTPTQIKIIRVMVMLMMGTNVLQAVVNRRLFRDLSYMAQRYNNLHQGTQYLLNVIEERGIEFGEFDLIALKTILEESNGR